MEGLFKPLLDRLSDALPHIIGVIVVGLIIGYAYTWLHNRAAQLRQRRREWKLNGGAWKLFKPNTWTPIQSREHFSAKHDLLKNETIRNTYAPPEKFTRELREKERAWKLAWLSPFRDAVKASIKDTITPKDKKLEARTQVRVAAQAVRVGDLPPGVFVGTAKQNVPEQETERQKVARLKRQEAEKRLNHFRVDLSYMGKDPATIQRLQGVVQTAAKGRVELLNSEDPTGLTFIVHRKKVIDPLTQSMVSAEYLREHRATSPYDLVLGIRQDGEPAHFLTHHTMVLGASGSGKGSPIQASILQLAPFVKQGTVELYGIDPKRAEFALYDRFRSPLFKSITLGSNDDDLRGHAQTINHLLSLIDERSRNVDLSIDEGAVEDGRDFTATKKTPMVMFYIDEFPSLFRGFEKLGKDGKTPLAELEQVISMGRSFGVYVMLATQRGEKSLLDSVRPNITNPVLLRQPSQYMNTLFLGDDSIANGFDSRKIPPSTKPKYETAGIGYTLDALGEPMKLRYAYTSKDDMAALIREFRAIDENEFDQFKKEDAARKRAAEAEALSNDGSGFAITDEDDNELPELEPFVLDDPEEEKDWSVV
jgi:hypothetical protein